MVAIDKIRLEKLCETWRYVREHSPYYRGILPEIHSDELTFDHLREVPVLSQQLLLDRGEELRCKRTLPAFLTFSGGTTGVPRFICGSREELDSTIQKTLLTKHNDLRPLVLSTDGGHHGTVPGIPGEMGFIQIPFRNRKNYAWGYTLLASRFNYAGFESHIRYASLPLPTVKKLVHFILENNLRTDEFQLTAIKTYAWHLTESWRELISRTLGCAVFDCYGFSEICSGNTTQCPGCGWHHFSDRVIVELVDPDTHAPIKEGVGALVMTSLRPHVSDHVLLRYDPGDAVEVGPFCELAGDVGYRPLGKLKYCVRVQRPGEAKFLFFPVDVQEIIDMLPDVGRLEETRFAGVSSLPDDCFPKWRSVMSRENSIEMLDIQIELRWSPWLFRSRRIALERQIKDELLARNSFLAAEVSSGRVALRISLLSPGTLPDDEVVLC